MNTQISTGSETEIWKLMMSQANHLIKSNALPEAIRSPEQALAIIQYGRELNLPPMTALQNISLIKGKPTLSANLIGARLKNAGYKFKVKKYEDKVVELEFTDLDGEKQTFSYTMDEATKAGNATKMGEMYKKYGSEMLYARCLTRGGRIVAPEVLAGVYAPEEFNVDDTKEVTPKAKVDVTPIEDKEIQEPDFVVQGASVVDNKKESTSNKSSIEDKNTNATSITSLQQFNVYNTLIEKAKDKNELTMVGNQIKSLITNKTNLMTDLQLSMLRGSMKDKLDAFDNIAAVESLDI